MNITALTAFADNYIWTIRDNKRLVVVDPGDARPVRALIKQTGLELEAILITHHHWDHTNGVETLWRQFEPYVYGPDNSPCQHITHPLPVGNTIQLLNGALTFEVLGIPGHTLDHIAFYGHDALFCGDTLFSYGCGRVFEGTHDMMFNSLHHLARLPKQTRLYCGHEYTLNNLEFAQHLEPNHAQLQTEIKRIRALRDNNQPTLPSTMSEQLALNPFLRCDDPPLQKAVAHLAPETPTTPLETFTQLRQLKDQY